MPVFTDHATMAALEEAAARLANVQLTDDAAAAPPALAPPQAPPPLGAALQTQPQAPAAAAARRRAPNATPGTTSGAAAADDARARPAAQRVDGLGHQRAHGDARDASAAVDGAAHARRPAVDGVAGLLAGLQHHVRARRDPRAEPPVDLRQHDVFIKKQRLAPLDGGRRGRRAARPGGGLPARGERGEHHPRRRGDDDDDDPPGLAAAAAVAAHGHADAAAAARAARLGRDAVRRPRGAAAVRHGLGASPATPAPGARRRRAAAPPSDVTNTTARRRPTSKAGKKPAPALARRGRAKDQPSMLGFR